MKTWMKSTYHAYKSKGVATADIRAGMGFYKSDLSHSMLIYKVDVDADGTPTQVHVGEANAGSTHGGWENPPGQTPWLRTLGTSRHPVSYGKAIDYES